MAPPAQAFIDSLHNMTSMTLDALDFIDNNVLRILIGIFLLAVGAASFSIIAANLLDWSSAMQVGLNNPLVNSAWSFMIGFANMVFILVFLAIALAYVFKIETWGMKKALPRLIIIALLLNFSLLFVKIFVDIGWILQNSFKETMFGAGGIAATTIGPLIDGLKSVIKGYAMQFGIYIALAPFPGANVSRLIGFATSMLLSESFFGTFSQAAILIVFGFTAGLVFFIYSILFLLRIVIIWFLAIAAPLAFVALVMPNTQKYFYQWLRYLIQWTFLGVVVFFLMGFGLKLFTLATPPGSFRIVNFGIWGISSGHLQFIFLIVYLAAALWMSKKFAPAGTNAVWSLGTLAATGGAALAAKRARQLGLRAQIGVSEITAKTKRRIDERQATGQKLSWQQRLASPWLRQVRPELAEARAAAARSELVKEQRNKIVAKTKDMDEEGVKAVLRAEMEKHKEATIKDTNKAIALAQLLIEKNAQKDADEDFVRKAWEATGPKDVSRNTLKRNALKRMIHWAKPGDWERPKEDMEAFLGKLTPSDIENLNIAAKENNKVAEMVVGTMRSDLISRLGSQNQISLKNVQDQIEEQLGKKWRGEKPGGLDERELRTLRNLHASSAFSNINLKIPGSHQEIEDRIKNLGQPPKKETPKIILPGSEEFRKGA